MSTEVACEGPSTGHEPHAWVHVGLAAATPHGSQLAVVHHLEEGAEGAWMATGAEGLDCPLERTLFTLDPALACSPQT